MQPLLIATALYGYYDRRPYYDRYCHWHRHILRTANTPIATLADPRRITLWQWV
jgi:hypothetical protein